MKIGIDLGTTYSAVARYDGKTSRASIIPNRFGKELTPSVICFLQDETLIGEDAKDMQAGGAGVNAASFKRSMGDEAFKLEAYGKEYTAEDLSAILLRQMIREVEESTGEKVEEAVITVPAYFDNYQRNATKRAGESCGIKVPRIINEPTAAAIAYGYKHSDDKTILVYDLGGGTFDVTIVKVSKGSIEVIGTAGNHTLGGKDWDAVLIDDACDRFEDEFGQDPRDDQSAMDELIVASEDYKKLLTKSGEITVTVKYGGETGRYTITREEFDAKTRHLLDATKDVITKLLSDLNLRPVDVDDVLLVGGSTLMPQVPEFLEDFTGKKAIGHIDTNLAVAKGAAITAELYCSGDTRVRDTPVVEDVTAHSLGILSVSPDGTKYVNEVMIKRNSKIPSVVKKPFKIEEGNPTDKIEVYTLQGESRIPLDCVLLGKEVISGFDNQGDGLIVNICYNYDDNGIVHVTADLDGEELEVEHTPLDEDVAWMGDHPAKHASSIPIMRNIVVCVDLSRSMTKSLDEAKSAINDFVNKLNDGLTKFSLVGFGDKVMVYSDLTDDAVAFKDTVAGLKVNVLGRGTDASPLSTAKGVLDVAKGAKMIVVLTDGVWGKRDKAMDESMECRKDRIQIAAIGIGDADTSFLKQIATVKEGAMYTTLNNLGSAFSTIATVISKNTGLREQ